MDLIASGMTNQQIAATCFISQKTVKNHINRIFAKLHAAAAAKPSPSGTPWREGGRQRMAERVPTRRQRAQPGVWARSWALRPMAGDSFGVRFRVAGSGQEEAGNAESRHQGVVQNRRGTP